MRSPILIASSMSWVTKTTVLRISRWRRRNSFWSRSRLIGSMAPKGSSISISGGSTASARATPTRWRWPPESWPGSGRASRRVEAHELEQLVHPGADALAVPAEQARDRGDVVGHAEVREQADLLDRVADLAPQLGRAALADALAVEQDVALGDVDHPVDHPHRGGLAAAGGADQHADLAGWNGEREAVRTAGSVLPRVALGGLAKLESGCLGARRRPRGVGGVGILHEGGPGREAQILLRPLWRARARFAKP